MIYLFTEGSGRHLVDFEAVDVESRHILFISQGQVHAFDRNKTYDGKALIFTEHFFCRTNFDTKFLLSTPLFANDFSQSYFKINSCFDQLVKLFEEVFDELRHRPDTKQGMILHNLLWRILLLAEREVEGQAGVQKVLSDTEQLAIKFKKAVNEHFKTRKRISFYIDILHVGIRRLQLATAASFNKTPKQMVSDRLLLEAKRMLTYEDLSIKEISDHLGFDETTSFDKFFKSKLGIAPSEFKRNL